MGMSVSMRNEMNAQYSFRNASTVPSAWMMSFHMAALLGCWCTGGACPLLVIRSGGHSICKRELPAFRLRPGIPAPTTTIQMRRQALHSKKEGPEVLRLPALVRWSKCSLQQLADRVAIFENIHRPAGLVGEGLRRIDADGAVDGAKELRGGAPAIAGQ